MINEDPLKIYEDIIKIANEEFREEEHPRDSDGKFTDKGGGDNGDNETPKINDMTKSISTQYGRGKTSYGMGTNWLMKQNEIDYPEEFEELDNTIADWDSLERWEELKEEWDNWISENPDAKQVIDNAQKQVDEVNDILKKNYETSKVFYRGTSIFELNDLDINGEFESENYDFTSLTMNEEQAKTTYNKGVVIELDGTFVRGNSSLVKYVAEPTKIQAFEDELDGSVDSGEIESTDTPVNALFIDEQEVRMDNIGVRLEPEHIKKVTIDFGRFDNKAFERTMLDLGIDGTISHDSVFFEQNKNEIEEAIRKTYTSLSKADLVIKYEKFKKPYSLFL